MPNHQLNLPPLPLANGTQPESVRPDSTQEADALASVLFDQSLTRAQLTTADVAYQLKISESLVRRLRSADARERVSFAQILSLPPSFLLELTKALNARFGFGRAALLDLLDAAGRLAVADKGIA
jgi:DNA-binding transcriptional regulator LsrR (DeoR family)